MSSKAIAQDIQDEGFTAVQFNVASGAAWTTYVATLLSRAGTWAQQRVTETNYTAAGGSGYAFDSLVRAEIAYVAEVLWKRRAATLDANGTTNLQDDKRAAQWKQAMANAEQAQADMTFWIGEAQRTFGMDVQADIPGTGISTGVVETGAFRQTDTSALNYQGAQ
jgi:hypothetical protein